MFPAGVKMEGERIPALLSFSVSGVSDPFSAVLSLFFPAVIKMEGGTEHDLRILEQEEEEERTEKAEGPKKEEPRPPEPAGKGPAERPDGEEGAKVGDFGDSLVLGVFLGFPEGFSKVYFNFWGVYLGLFWVFWGLLSR